MYRRSGRGRLLLLVFLALSILVITLDFRGGGSGPLASLREISQAIVAPIQRGVTTVTRPIGNFFSSVGDLANLREQNTEMKVELERAREAAARSDDLVEENAELRAHLGLTEAWFAQDKVAAQVISDAPGNWRWAVVIDKGRADGIRPDMAVVNPDGLVGKVITADATTSTVLLMIDPEFGAAAATKDGIQAGIASGNGEGRPLTLGLVEKDRPLGDGDSIVTSNYNRGIFPRGIPIGFVSEIGGDPRSAYQDVQVTPSVDFNDLNVVEVLLETGRDVTGGAK